MAITAKATPILNDKEVRQVLDLDDDIISSDQLNVYSQEASDFVLKATGRDWGDSQYSLSVGSSLAKQLAGVYVRHSHGAQEKDYSKQIDWLTSRLLDVIAEEDANDS